MIWTLPTPGLYPVHRTAHACTEFSGYSLAQALTRGGLPCTCTQAAAGPQIDRYTFALCDIYKISRLRSLLPALETLTGCTVRRAALAPAGAFVLEISRRNRNPVYFGDCISNAAWLTSSTPAALVGVGAAGQITALNVDRAPHVLIAGQTGAGKSVLMNSIICSLLFKNGPDTSRFIFIDPKLCEFAQYKSLPHVKKGDFIASAPAALQTLQTLCTEMDTRYTRMTKTGQRQTSEAPTYIFIDELADLMMTAGPAKKQMESAIVRLAQKGRAAGYHLIIATQSPRTSVITGLIAANIPVKVALTVSSARESCIILGHGGAEKLTGRGDCILKTPLAGEMRLQAPFISDQEIALTVQHWTRQTGPCWLKWLFK